MMIWYVRFEGCTFMLAVGRNDDWYVRFEGCTDTAVCRKTPCIRFTESQIIGNKTNRL